MTDKQKLQKIEEILSGGSQQKVLETLKKEIKDKLNFDVDLNFDGTIKRYWWNERPKRQPRKKKATEATETKPTEEKKK